MASASSFFSSMALRCLSAGRIDRPLVAHLRPNPILRPHSSLRPVIAFYSRRNNTASAITSSKQKKKKLSRNDVAEEDDEDALEALFSQLEEDLKNDDPSLDDDNVGEISEEDLAKLESELEEALADDELVGAFDSAKDGEISSMADGDDNDDDKEEEMNLKNWQFRRLAYALKNGRRKTSIKNLAADVCLDRSVVLQLLRDPPPNLLLMSAALPDKTISEPESEPQETVSEETTANEAHPEDKVKRPVHVMHSSWSAQKRLKKVQVETLERVYARTKRPTNAMISSIVHVTNLPRKRVVKWFEDKRTEDGVPDHRLTYQSILSNTCFMAIFFLTSNRDLSVMRHREEATTEFGGLRRCQSFEPAATLRMEHGHRPNGEQFSRPQKVVATSEPPFPKPSRCFCQFFRKTNK